MVLYGPDGRPLPRNTPDKTVPATPPAVPGDGYAAVLGNVACHLCRERHAALMTPIYTQPLEFEPVDAHSPPSQRRLRLRGKTRFVGTCFRMQEAIYSVFERTEAPN